MVLTSKHTSVHKLVSFVFFVLYVHELVSSAVPSLTCITFGVNIESVYRRAAVSWSMPWE